MPGAGQTGYIRVARWWCGVWAFGTRARMCGNPGQHVLTGWCSLSAPCCFGLPCRAQGWRSIRLATRNSRKVGGAADAVAASILADAEGCRRAKQENRRRTFEQAIL